MQSDFSLTVAPVRTYKLVIPDRNTSELLLQVHLYFHSDCIIYKSDGVKQFQDHLSNMLDEIPKEKWNRENVLSLVSELMCETPFSHSIDEIRPVKGKK